MFVAVTGDVDKDGVPDAYASDFANRAKGPSTGRVYVHSGKTGARLLTLTGEGPGEGFGTSASTAGDLDGDGHADLAVLGFDSVGIGDTDGDGTVDLLLTSAYSGINGYHSGRVFVLSSGITKQLPAASCQHPAAHWIALGVWSLRFGVIDLSFLLRWPPFPVHFAPTSQ